MLGLSLLFGQEACPKGWREGSDGKGLAFANLGSLSATSRNTFFKSQGW